jgi:hypothetical protein
MARPDGADAREAKHGEKMIEVKVRFWTDDLAGSHDKVIPKHAWTAGVIRIERNGSHGIVPGKPITFNSLLDMGSAIEKVLKNQGIVLHVGRGMKAYISTGEN